MAQPSEAKVYVRLLPNSGLRAGIRELFAYRELLFVLTWRDIKVRYKQTVLGAAWALLQPGLTMVVFSIFFGRLARVPSEGVPYPVFALAGLVPWQLFAHALVESSNSMLANERLITKIYFPRAVIPVSALLSGLVDFAIAFVLLLVLIAYYGIAPSPAVAAVLLFLLLAMASALGAGMWLAALNVKFRDVRYTLAFLTQVWLFATPIAYPSSLVPRGWRVLYALNPMVGVVEGFRWSLLRAGNPPDATLLASAVSASLLLVSGWWYFHRMEASFADVI